jgi:hypothetical protein
MMHDLAIHPAPSSRRKPGSQATSAGPNLWREIPACAGMTLVERLMP